MRFILVPLFSLFLFGLMFDACPSKKRVSNSDQIRALVNYMWIEDFNSYKKDYNFGKDVTLEELLVLFPNYSVAKPDKSVAFKVRPLEFLRVVSFMYSVIAGIDSDTLGASCDGLIGTKLFKNTDLYVEKEDLPEEGDMSRPYKVNCLIRFLEKNSLIPMKNIMSGRIKLSVVHCVVKNILEKFDN